MIYNLSPLLSFPLTTCTIYKISFVPISILNILLKLFFVLFFVEILARLFTVDEDL